MHATVLLNAAAGGAARGDPADLARELKSALAAAGIEGDLQIVPPDQMTHALRAQVASAGRTVIVGGGDGTIRTAGELLAGTEHTLGVLPLGTLNHFARDLGLPADWREAVAAFPACVEKRVDVGEVNRRVFLNNCSIGAYAEAVRRRDALRRRDAQGKWRAMFRAALTTFRRFHRFRLRVEGDGPARSVRTPLLVVGNNRYSGHVLDACLRPRLDEGQLWIYTAHVHRHLAWLRLALQSLVHGLDRAEALEARAAGAFTVHAGAGENPPVALDGESVDLVAPFHFRIRPAALRVLAPPPKQHPR